MSIEKPQNQESVGDEMILFRQKVSDLIQDERNHHETAHFDTIIDIKKFVDSLTEEDLKWFDFIERVRTLDVVPLSESDIVTYTGKLQEFRNIQKNVEEPRALWYEFLANKLTGFSLKLQMLEMRRGIPPVN